VLPDSAGFRDVVTTLTSRRKPCGANGLWGRSNEFNESDCGKGENGVRAVRRTRRRGALIEVQVAQGAETGVEELLVAGDSARDAGDGDAEVSGDSSQSQTVQADGGARGLVGGYE
jgi:hypothetical protein